jgi:hypothetical protein
MFARAIAPFSSIIRAQKMACGIFTCPENAGMCFVLFSRVPKMWGCAFFTCQENTGAWLFQLNGRSKNSEIGVLGFYFEVLVVMNIEYHFVHRQSILNFVPQ